MRPSIRLQSVKRIPVLVPLATTAVAHEAGHTHGPGCGHEAVPHGDHIDYLVAGHLHHPHGDHCDDHGPITVMHA